VAGTTALAAHGPKDAAAGNGLLPYDENLLERARIQWHVGDWDALAQIAGEAIQHHPARAKLALLVSAAHQQNGNSGQARNYLLLAKDWGCSKTLAAQVLLASAHNTLGRAALLLNDPVRAHSHFRTALADRSGSAGMVQARQLQEQVRMGLGLAQLSTVVPDTHE
jgi:hypothetical protein